MPAPDLGWSALTVDLTTVPGVAARDGRGVVPVAVAVALVLATLVSFAGALVFDVLLSRAERPDLTQFDLSAVPFVLAAVSAAAVGLVLGIHRPAHPVGWLLGCLALSIGLAGLADGWSSYGALARPGSVAGAGYAAAYSVAGFVPWVSLVSAILLLTPTGRPPGRGWWWLPATALSGVLLMLVQSTSPVFPDPSLPVVPNPLALALPFGIRAVLTPVAFGAVLACLIAAIAVLVVRYRRADAGTRRRLKWVTLAGVLVPVPITLVLIALVAFQSVGLALWFAGGYVSLLPLSVGLSVMRFDLFDVDMLVRRAVTYVVVTVVLVVTYAVLIVSVGWALGAATSASSGIAVAAATLGAVALFAPLRRLVQDRLDRTFNRRRYEAAAVMRQFARGQGPVGDTVQDALARAVSDVDLRLGLWLADEARLVDPNGHPVEIIGARVELNRDGELVAVIGHRDDPVIRELVSLAAAAVPTELDNARLRAAIRSQLVEVRESRRRIVAAGLIERRKVERNLHDGAQQRLVALAMRLRAAQLVPQDTTLLLDAAVAELNTAVAELRELASGLLPPLLGSEGLAAALEDFADRTDARIEVHAPETRFPGEIEAALYFVACEAVTNAVKHAHATTITLDVSAGLELVELRVRDDGSGGADPSGGGLRGLADRAEALGGRLQVHSEPHGTLIRVELPCG